VSTQDGPDAPEPDVTGPPTAMEARSDREPADGGSGPVPAPADALTPAEGPATGSEDAVPPVGDGEHVAYADGADVAYADADAEKDGTSEDDVPEATLGAPTLDAAIEAVLLVTDQPIDVATLASLVRRPADEVLARLVALSADYAAAARGFDLREVAGGWRFYTRSDCAEVVERFVRDGQQARLTQAALETLAVVAYRQPVSRARISAVRGVNVDGVIRTLTSRGLVAEAGHDETSGAILYRTTELFLERLGLTTLDDLPPVADYLPDIEMLDEFIEQTSS
jgi:segregation and condensation protein B